MIHEHRLTMLNEINSFWLNTRQKMMFKKVVIFKGYDN